MDASHHDESELLFSLLRAARIAHRRSQEDLQSRLRALTLEKQSLERQLSMLEIEIKMLAE